MKKNIALLFSVIVSSFIAVQPAIAQEHKFQDISQKIEKLSQGLVGSHRCGCTGNWLGREHHSKRR